jgi:hypothetical protein
VNRASTFGNKRPTRGASGRVGASARRPRPLTTPPRPPLRLGLLPVGVTGLCVFPVARFRNDVGQGERDEGEPLLALRVGVALLEQLLEALQVLLQPLDQRRVLARGAVPGVEGPELKKNFFLPQQLKDTNWQI